MAASSSDEMLKHVINEVDKEDKEIKQHIGNPSTCSGVRKGAISDAELADLARKISSKSMEEIAIKYLGFEGYEIDNEYTSVREHQWKFNFNILTAWRNRCTEDDSRQALGKILQKAARSIGGLNYSNVKEILGITEENLNIPQNEKEAEKETGNDATYGNTIQVVFQSSKEREPELTDKMVFKLAHRITDLLQLNDLAYRGLRLKNFSLEEKLCYSTDPTNVAYKILMEWLRSQPDRKQAHRNLCKALEDANLASLIGNLY